MRCTRRAFRKGRKGRLGGQHSRGHVGKANLSSQVGHRQETHSFHAQRWSPVKFLFKWAKYFQYAAREGAISARGTCGRQNQRPDWPGARAFRWPALAENTPPPVSLPYLTMTLSTRFTTYLPTKMPAILRDRSHLGPVLSPIWMPHVRQPAFRFSSSIPGAWCT